MSGFEHQAASNMIAEGLLLEGLAVTRAIEDRYSARLRNPFNEIECSDHYSRSMASFGSFISICGFDYHGPKGHIGFAPRLHPENFKAAFTTAAGWGTFTLKKHKAGQTATLHVRWGTLKLNTISLPSGKTKRVAVDLAGRNISAKLSAADDAVLITLDQSLMLQAGDLLTIKLL